MLGLTVRRVPWQLKAAIIAAALAAAGMLSIDPNPALAVPALTPGSFATPPIAVGGSHVCALPGDGTVLCWGDNTFGQIGNGRVTDPHAPAGDVFVQQTVIADEAGAGGGDCVDVTEDGSVIHCHGNASLTGVTAIAAGYSHTCALLGDGTVRCWGSNEPVDGGGFGASLSGGELGDGTTVVRPFPVPVIAGPGQAAELVGVRALSAAAGYTCAVLDDGTAKCWGNAPQATSTAPLTVTTDGTTPLTGITSISAGDANACATLTGGSVVCWGTGYLGDQRSDTARDGKLPVTVTEEGSARPALGGIAMLALGHNVFNGPNGFGMGHSCALTTTGEVRCWGWNDVSQLGNGFNMVTGGFDNQRDFAVPVIAAPGASAHLQGVTAIAAGGYFTCALVGSGVVCWGLDFGGDSFEGAGAPVPLEIAPATAGSGSGHVTLAGFNPGSGQTAAAPIADVVAIAAGGSICAIRADGSLWCSDGAGGMAAIQGVAVAAAAPIPAPTPQPTSATTPTAAPVPSGAAAGPAEAVVGYWDSGRIQITYAGGVYTATNIADRAVQNSTCVLAAGTVLATFSGSGGQYQGQDLGWSDLTTCTPVTVAATYRLDGDSLTRSFPSGVQIVWVRSATPVLQGSPKTFRNSIPGPGEINLSPEVVVQTLAFTAGLLLLIPFPGALFNGTLEANYTEIMGSVRRARRRARNLLSRPWRFLRGIAGGRRAEPAAMAVADEVAATGTTPIAAEAAAGDEPPRDFWWTRRGVGLFLLLTVLLSGFLDPSFWFNVPSLETFIGMLLGLVVLLVAFDLPLVAFYRTHDVSFRLHALPATAIVAIACVVISRVTDFQPGYLYGLIIATATAPKVDKMTEGKLMAAGVTSSIVVAIVAWFGIGVVNPIAAATDDPGPVLVIVQTVLSMCVAAGIELAAFGMIPITYLVGKSIFSWNKLVWAGLFGFGWIAFGIVILNPQDGYFDPSHTPIVTVVALLVFFGAVSLLFWAYFRRRKAVPQGGPA